MPHLLSRRRRWAVAVVLCSAVAAGCTSSDNASSGSANPSRGEPASPEQPLTQHKLESLLLTEADLGASYTQTPSSEDDDGQYDDIAVDGCPPLEELGKNSRQMQFVSKAEAGYRYQSGAEFGEEIYSDSPATLSRKLRAVASAYTSCSSYTMTSGSTPIDVKVTEPDTPDLGEEQFGYTLTMSPADQPQQSQVLKTLAVRKGNVAVMLVGAPALVDRHIATAVGRLDHE